MDKANEVAGWQDLLCSFRPTSPHVRSIVGGAGPVPICFGAGGLAVFSPNPE
jgi:hypothetical protein